MNAGEWAAVIGAAVAACVPIAAWMFGVHGKLAEIATQMKDFNGSVKPRLDDHGNRLDEHDRRIAHHCQLMVKHEARLDHLDERCNERHFNGSSDQ